MIRDLHINDAEARFIINTIIRETGISLDRLKDKTRKREVVIARHLAMFLIKLQNEKMTWKGIGMLFGDRDHSSVKHAYSAVISSYQTNRQFKNNVDKICEEICPKLKDKVSRIAS